MKKGRKIAVVMSEEAWELFDSYAVFMQKRTNSPGPTLSGTLAGAVVEFFLLAMKDDILRGKEEVGFNVFKRKFGKVRKTVEARGLPLPEELPAGDTQAEGSSPEARDVPDADGAGRQADPDRKKLKIPWPV
jgi:hypothetical protein